MLDIVLMSVLLTLVQVLLPTALNVGNLGYLLSNREEPITLSPISARAQRAASNLLETLPIFLALAGLSIFYEIGNTTPALLWVVCRVFYLACYTFGITVVRSLAFVASIVCLIQMSMGLL